MKALSLNKQFLRAAALPLACLMLAGCAAKTESEDGGDLHISELEVQEVRETDISKRYPDYFKYCFGEDASFIYQHTDEYGRDFYQLEYRDHTGTLWTTDFDILPYAQNDDFEQYPTEDSWYSADMEMLAMDELDKILKREFAAQVLEQYLDGHRGDSSGWQSVDWQDSEEVQSVVMVPIHPIYIRQPIFLSWDDEVGQRLAYAHIAPGTGWQVCTADWQSVAADEQTYMTLSVTISENADPDAYSEKMNRIIEAYENAGGAPKSYTFVLYQANPEGSDEERHTVMRKTVVLGEEIDLSKMGEDFRVGKYVSEKLVEKHRNDP